MRRISLLLLILAVATVVVTGCTGKANRPSAASTPGLLAVPSVGPFPAVAGGFGDKPTMTFASGVPSSRLQRKILRDGTGPAVTKGDLLVADYLGQIWSGKVFDNSYDAHQVAAFPIGIGKVIAGWDRGLVGLKAGTRVLLTIPPADAYGETGDAQAGIEPTDTLVFVVDIARSYGQRDAAALTATSSTVPSGAPTVTGAPGARPAITIPPKLAPPAVRRVVVLAEGEGPAVTKGSIVVEYEASSWIGKFIASTWQNGIPTLVPVGDASATQTRGLYDDLVGIRLGSRVLLKAPAGSGEDRFQGSVAMVIDLLAEPTTAKQMDAG